MSRLGASLVATLVLLVLFLGSGVYKFGIDEVMAGMRIAWLGVACVTAVFWALLYYILPGLFDRL